MRNLDNYGPATCPRCLKPARIFSGRYHLICAQCVAGLREPVEGFEDTVPAPAPVGAKSR